jgi:hypothetical protein
MDVQAENSTTSSFEDEHPLVKSGAHLMDALAKLLQSRAGSDAERGDDVPIRQRERSDALQENCRALAEHNAWLATAVGACTCWGFNTNCSICDGHGGPGTFPVERAAFAAVVAPLVALQPKLFTHLSKAAPRVRKRNNREKEVLKNGD